MVTWAVQLAVVALFAVVSGLLVLAWQRGRLGVASIALFVAAIVVWALEIAALATGSGGADGFATCTEDCTPVHYVSAVAFLAPPLLMALSAVGMLVSIGRRILLRRAQAHEVAG
jgi:hypothetical protein